MYAPNRQFFVLVCIAFFTFFQEATAQSTYTFPINIKEGIQNGQISVTNTTLDIGTIENAFDGLLVGPVARSAGINPMIVTLEFPYQFDITATSIYSDNIESGFWTVESANTLTDLDAKTGSYQMLLNQIPYTAQVQNSQFVNATGHVLRLTMHRLTGGPYVHLHEWGITATATVNVVGLCMKPNSVRLIQNAEFQPNWYALDAAGNELSLTSGVTWSSDAPSIVGVDNTGIFSSNGTLGESTITASFSGTDFETKVKVVTDFESPAAEKQIVKVAMIIINPPIAAANGQRFSEIFWPGHGGPMVLAQQTRDSMLSISGGVVDYQFTEIHDEPTLLTKFGGTEISVDSMYQLFLEPNWTTLRHVAGTLRQSEFLYNDMLNKYDLCTKSNNHEIDEVWIWAMPFVGLFESNMTGTDAFWINGGVIRNNSCTDLLPMMGFNYERYAGCALHNFSHRIETTMYKLFGSNVRYVTSNPPYPAGVPLDPIQTFMLYDSLDIGNAHIGNSHFPPNGLENYDYNNLDFVPTHAPNWKRYPYLFDETMDINCNAWGCEGDCGLNYMSWWMRHIPHFKCKDKTGILNNWWPYIIDYNEGKALEAQLSNCDCAMFDDASPNCASKGEFPWHEWIANVKIADLDKASDKSQYSDFTDETLHISTGNNYSMELTTGFSYFTYDEYWRVWLDKNKNGIFEDAEKVAEGKLDRPADGTAEATLTIPNVLNFPVGSGAVSDMKMRVSMKRGSYPTACETFPFGEVEDYTVDLSDDATVCALTAHVSNMNCDSPFVSFTLLVDAVNGGQNGWVGSYNLGPYGNTIFINGQYGVAEQFNVFIGHQDSIQFLIFNPGTSSCNTTFTVSCPTAPGAYCPSQGLFPWEDWIGRVQVADLDNTSGKSQYSDFTDKTIHVDAGEMVNISLETGFSYFTFDEYWRVWVDYNQNGIFETTEILLSEVALKPADGTFSNVLSSTAMIPSGFAQDITTRMRVAMKRGAFPSPCEIFDKGEVEDYSIFIKANPMGGGADLELLLTADKSSAAAYSTVTYTLTVKNSGSETINSAEIYTGVCDQTGASFSQSSGLVYAGIPTDPNLGSYNYISQKWTIQNLEAGQTGVLTIPLYTLTNAERKIITYCTAQSPSDPDSQPGSLPSNCLPTQDDEALWTLNAGQSILQQGNRKENMLEMEISDFGIFPNPSGDEVFVHCTKWDTGNPTITMYNHLGIRVLRKLITAETERLDLSEIPNGNYYLKIETAEERAVFKKLVVARLY